MDRSGAAVRGDWRSTAAGRHAWPFQAESLVVPAPAEASALIAAIPERGIAAPGRLTGMAYAFKHEAMRDRVRHITLRTYDVSAAWLKTAANRRELPMPADTLVRVLHALVEGLTYQRLLTPELFPDEVIYAAFAAFANRRMSRPRKRKSTPPARAN